MSYRLLRFVLALALATALSGCAKYYGAAKIVSTPAGAEVIDLQDDTVIGVTPLIVHWEDSSRNRRYVALRLKKAGYKDDISHFWVSMRHRSKNAAEESSEEVKVELNQR